MHAKNLAKSLNELYTDPAPSTPIQFDVSHEFPLTRSVSTTTDIFSTCSNGGFTATNSNSHKSLQTFTPQPNKRATYRQECQLPNANYKSLSRDGSRDSLHDAVAHQHTKGILMNRTKSKDELFMEFCKKAGQRPKPKDIYFVDHTPYDEASRNDVFIVQNYATIRKNRRNSNYIEAAQKTANIYNSNQSLNYPRNNAKTYAPQNIFDADAFGGSTEHALLNSSHDNYLQRSRSNSRDTNLYGSRTLPKDFMKRTHTYDMDDLAARRISANGLYTPYNLSMTLPATAAPVVAQPPQPPTATADFYQKSFDTLANRNGRQRDANTAGNEDTLSVQWPSAIPSSPRFGYATFYSPSTQRKATQMSTFYSQHFPRAPTASASNRFDDVDYENTDIRNSCEQLVDDSVLVNESDSFDTFDLDRLERERRKSHASLFEIDVDFGNGTAV